MMNNSRYLSAVIAAFMSVAVAGCGGSGAASAPVSTEVVKEVVPVITVQPKAVYLTLGSAAPGVGTWTTKSSKVKPQEAHLDHWHINRQ